MLLSAHIIHNLDGHIFMDAPHTRCYRSLCTLLSDSFFLSWIGDVLLMV